MKNKTTGDLALARRIRAAGCPIYIAEDEGEARVIPSDGLKVFQWGGVNDSTVNVLTSYGGIAVIIYLGVTFNLSNFAISSFRFEPPWKNDSFYWLPDPLEIDDSSDCYRFGVRDLPTFERSRVLNHYADERKIHSKGETLKGCLLGFGTDAIPKNYQHGMISAFVDIYDQHGRVHRTSVKLWLVRSNPQTLVLPKRRRLIGGSEPVPPEKHVVTGISSVSRSRDWFKKSTR